MKEFHISGYIEAYLSLRDEATPAWRIIHKVRGIALIDSNTIFRILDNACIVGSLQRIGLKNPYLTSRFDDLYAARYRIM